MAKASYVFAAHDGDDGIIPDVGEKQYSFDWGEEVSIVKGICSSPNWLSDEETAKMLRSIGARVLKVDGRPAKSNGDLVAPEEGDIVTAQFPVASYTGKRFKPRKAVFYFEDNTSMSIIIPSRRKLKATIDQIKDTARLKRAIVSIKLVGEKVLDSMPILMRLFNVTRTAQQNKSVERWNSKQSDDTDRRNAYFIYPFKYWADLGQDGKQNSEMAMTWRVLSQGDKDGDIVKPSVLPNTRLEAMMKKQGDDTVRLRARFCQESRVLDPRHIIGKFAIADDSEGASLAREMVAEMNIPISFWDDQSDIGQDGIRNALQKMVKNQEGLICLDYYGESNSHLEQFYEPTLLQRIV